MDHKPEKTIGAEEIKDPPCERVSIRNDGGEGSTEEAVATKKSNSSMMLGLLDEFSNIYADKLKRVEEISIKCDEKEYLERKVCVLEGWVHDLGEQNSILVVTVEELEREAATRVALLEERLAKMATTTRQSCLSLQDHQVQVSSLVRDKFGLEQEVEDLGDKIQGLECRNASVLEENASLHSDLTSLIQREVNDNVDSLVGRLRDLEEECRDLRNINRKLQESHKNLQLSHTGCSSTIHILQDQLNQAQKSQDELRTVLTSEVAQRHDQIVSLCDELKNQEQLHHETLMQLQLKSEVIKELRKEVRVLKEGSPTLHHSEALSHIKDEKEQEEVTSKVSTASLGLHEAQELKLHKLENEVAEKSVLLRELQSHLAASRQELHLKDETLFKLEQKLDNSRRDGGEKGERMHYLTGQLTNLQLEVGRTHGQAEKLRREVENKTDLIQKLEADNSSLTRQLNEKSNTLERLNDQLIVQSSELDKKKKEVNDQRVTINALQDALVSSKRACDQLRCQLQPDADELREVVRVAHEKKRMAEEERGHAHEQVLSLIRECNALEEQIHRLTKEKCRMEERLSAQETDLIEARENLKSTKKEGGHGEKDKCEQQVCGKVNQDETSEVRRLLTERDTQARLTQLKVTTLQKALQDNQHEVSVLDELLQEEVSEGQRREREISQLRTQVATLTDQLTQAQDRSTYHHLNSHTVDDLEKEIIELKRELAAREEQLKQVAVLEKENGVDGQRMKVVWESQLSNIKEEVARLMCETGQLKDCNAALHYQLSVSQDEGETLRLQIRDRETQLDDLQQIRDLLAGDAQVVVAAVRQWLHEQRLTNTNLGEKLHQQNNQIFQLNSEKQFLVERNNSLQRSTHDLNLQVHDLRVRFGLPLSPPTPEKGGRLYDMLMMGEGLSSPRGGTLSGSLCSLPSTTTMSTDTIGHLYPTTTRPKPSYDSKPFDISSMSPS